MADTAVLAALNTAVDALITRNKDKADKITALETAATNTPPDDTTEIQGIIDKVNAAQ